MRRSATRELKGSCAASRRHHAMASGIEPFDSAACGESVEDFLVCAGEASALAVEPSLELDAIHEVDAVEQRAGVKRRRALAIAGFHRTLELRHVGRDQLGVETELVTHCDDRLAADRLVDPVDGIREQGPTALAIGLGPEVRDDLLAPDAATARLPRCEDRQQRQTATLHRSSGQRTCRSFDGSSG